MLQKKNNTTPTTRFANIFRIYDFFKLKVDKIRSKNPKALKKKIFSKSLNVNVTNSFTLSIYSVIQNFVYNKKPYQLLLSAKTAFSQNIAIPGVENLYPGTVVYNFTKFYTIKKPKYLGSLALLENIPYQTDVSFLSNTQNNKWTFAKSSGTSCLRIKAKKTVKLVIISLPSEKLYHCVGALKCFVGKNTNYFIQKFVEGKWGYALHKCKKIVTRGVAMNPVDHPNGGRTKAKQPEKSPWGWIAKRNK